MNLRTQLKGTGVAIITPFKASMEVDFDALDKLIDFIIENGIEYIVTLGTTGETPALDNFVNSPLLLWYYCRQYQLQPAPCHLLSRK